MGIATVKGFFSDFEGSLEVGEDGTVSASGSVKAASINTRAAQREQHLRSPDFFDERATRSFAFSRSRSSRSTRSATGSSAI